MMIKVQVQDSIRKVSREDWQKLVPGDFPFVDYEFLSGLEAAHCLGSRTGWTPFYLLARREDQLVGALLSFVKTNSYGEYIFDFAWAQAHESVGLDYYPKLISAVPFTPATGPKILLSSELGADDRVMVSEALLSHFGELAQELDVSSLHALFITPSEIAVFEQAGFLIRHSYQYHWKNFDYSTFEDFLRSLRSKRRRELLRERATVAESGVRLERLTGSDLTAEHADLMYQFYMSTIDKMGGFNYLTREFFSHLFTRMSDRILLVLARDRAGDAVAGALNFFEGSKLFGRYWGCLDEYKALHFEVCYYQGIEFAIERGLTLFEAGAQGEHKFQRGFTPSLTYSAHRIQHPRLDEAIRDFVVREKRQLERLFEEYKAHTPFSREVKV